MHRLTLLAVAAATFVNAQSSTTSIDDLKWMAGHWAGPVGKAHSEELWLPPKAGMLLGMSRTTAGERLFSFEFLRIEQRPDGIYYVAQPQGRPAVNFKLTQATGTSAKFENPTHDHPKVISYRVENDELIASLEGDEKGQHKRQEFRFKLLASTRFEK